MQYSILAVACVVLCLAACSTSSDTGAGRSAPSSSEQMARNKAIARIWFDEVINQRNLDVIADTYAADYVHHGPGGAEIKGLAAAREIAAAILAASDDRHAEIEQQVAEGDLVVTRFTSRGHHTGVFRGLEPTGNLWTTEGICISRIKDGKIVEDWEIIHVSGL